MSDDEFLKAAPLRRTLGADRPTIPLWAKLLLGAGGLVAAGVVAAGFLNERRVADPEKASQDPRLRHASPGDLLLFYRPRRGRDYLIRWFTRSPFYHIAFFAGDDHVIEARPAGVGRNSLAGREDGYVVAPAPDGKGAEALAWAATQIGDGFDRTDFLVVVLEHIFVGWHINYTPPGRYDCAELVTAAFEHVGFKPFPGREPSEIDPADWSSYLPPPFDSEFAAA